MVMAGWKTKILFHEISGVCSLLHSPLEGEERWTPHQAKAVVWGTHWLLRDFNMVFHLPCEHPKSQLLAVLVGNLFCGRETGKSRNWSLLERLEFLKKISLTVFLLITAAFHLLDCIILEIKVAACKWCARTKGVDQTLWFFKLEHFQRLHNTSLCPPTQKYIETYRLKKFDSFQCSWKIHHHRMF